MLHRHVLAATLALGLATSGCSGGSPPTAPTTSVTTAATTSVETTPAATGTEMAAATPEATASGTPEETGTPTPGETVDPAYQKVKDEGINMAMAKGYAEAVPSLEKALELKPDDPEVHFYLMLSQGNLEETPGPKSEAYKHAKKVLELAPGSTMAERARDYILSAESEPAKPMKDLPADPIGPPRGWKVKNNAVYTLDAPVFFLPDKKMNDQLQKELWYLELVPNSVSEKVQLPKGTQYTVQEGFDYYYGKTSWRAGGAKPNPAEFDTNMYTVNAFEIEVENGPNKGKRGWFVNQMDRFLGVDEKEEAVFGVKIGPRLGISHDGK